MFDYMEAQIHYIYGKALRRIKDENFFQKFKEVFLLRYQLIRKIKRV